MGFPLLTAAKETSPGEMRFLRIGALPCPLRTDEALRFRRRLGLGDRAGARRFAWRRWLKRVAPGCSSSPSPGPDHDELSLEARRCPLRVQDGPMADYTHTIDR
jgi:hypothetical protein